MAHIKDAIGCAFPVYGTQHLSPEVAEIPQRYIFRRLSIFVNLQSGTFYIPIARFAGKGKVVRPIHIGRSPDCHLISLGFFRGTGWDLVFYLYFHGLSFCDIMTVQFLIENAGQRCKRPRHEQ